MEVINKIGILNNIKKQIIKIPIVAILIIFGLDSPLIWAQQDSKDPINYVIEAPEIIKSGDQFTITTVFNIKSGWYIYAPISTNVERGKIVTNVSFKIPSGIRKIGELDLPNEFLDTYKGENIRMTQKFEVEKNINSGKYMFEANIVYQTCSDLMCYPPVWKKVNIVAAIR